MTDNQNIADLTVFNALQNVAHEAMGVQGMPNSLLTMPQPVGIVPGQIVYDDEDGSAFVDNTKEQDERIAAWRGLVEIYPEDALKDIERQLAYIQRTEGLVDTRLAKDYQQFKANLEQLRQEANGEIERRQNRVPKQPMDLTEVVHPSVVRQPTEIREIGDADETPEVR